MNFRSAQSIAALVRPLRISPPIWRAGQRKQRKNSLCMWVSSSGLLRPTAAPISLPQLCEAAPQERLTCRWGGDYVDQKVSPQGRSRQPLMLFFVPSSIARTRTVPFWDLICDLHKNEAPWRRCRVAAFWDAPFGPFPHRPRLPPCQATGAFYWPS